MSQPLEAVLVGASGRGYRCHGMCAQKYPHKLRYVAVAEPDPVRRDRFGDLHNIPQKRRYASWQDLITVPPLFGLCARASQMRRPQPVLRWKAT